MILYIQKRNENIAKTMLVPERKPEKGLHCCCCFVCFVLRGEVRMCKSRDGGEEAEEEGLLRVVGARSHPQANGFLRRGLKAEA